MSHKYKNTKVYISSCTKGKQEVLGLSSLKNQLEKDYFSKIDISNSKVCCEENNLVIELYCPMGLHEVLFHIQQGNWGSHGPHWVNNGLSLLNLYMQEIRELNGTFIDVEELAIQLKDCTIIIKKIGPESVEKQLDTILSVLAENYVHLTRHLTMTPMEIFVPVYEEVETDNAILRLVGPNMIDEKGYYNYWGLYFESDEEALIYDLNNKKIIRGDLNLLDQ
ncbi:hypothetical protein [Muriicola soli]|uniref:Uncharacterized protein n=1 Tax=Muriicola soli TaxID=2507538 RepID=A0A411E9I8_9FLAO|nr:hypothetical protein [Muriicola soli]QBA64349.1 hypothetical protein EQY75_07275 [Muriicola soli]